MKAKTLVVMIPAYNEEASVGSVIKAVPREIGGTDKVKVLVIDDGSDDSTREAAKMAGADRVVGDGNNRGLGAAFRRGLRASLAMGADVIVNIDADGQYDGREIPALVSPVLKGEADLVLGVRSLESTDMPLSKLVGNHAATFATSLLSGVRLTDAQTGFRALSREAAEGLELKTSYTHVHETIIRAGALGLRIAELPITFRRRSGKSRLISSVRNYATREGVAMLKTYQDCHSGEFFGLIGGSMAALGVLFVFWDFFAFAREGAEFLLRALYIILLALGLAITAYGFSASRTGMRQSGEGKRG